MADLIAKTIKRQNNNDIMILVTRSTPFCKPIAQIAKETTITTNEHVIMVTGFSSKSENT